LRLLIVLFLAALTLEAAGRPKVGLVLSGGGARGAAHLGVLRVLERHRIPVDGIVGTSMGAFVGGLYASGMSVDAIETLLETTPWEEYISTDYNRKQIPFRRKKLQRDFPGNLKIGIDANGSLSTRSGLFKRQYMLQFLRAKTFPVSNIRDFDRLPIPFRAVATDLDNGRSVVLAEGSLAKSIYASLSIPGAFEPIVIGGRTLVDGGMSDNLPVDVMRREMKMDVIIVVDITTPFDSERDYDNFLSVIGQLTDIMSRRNVENNLASLRPDEILITPDLKGFSTLDAGSFSPIIHRGEAAAERTYRALLKPYGLSESAYAAYRRRLRSVPRLDSCPVIDEIRIDNPTWLDNRALLSRLRLKAGERPEFPEVQRDVEKIYNMMIFDEVDCRYDDVNGTEVLTIRTTPSEDVNGQLKFSIGFEDDFNGHSDYSARFEYIMFGINRYGGEWRSRGSIGIERLLYTELYQPLDPLQNFYIRPAIYYRNRKVYVNPAIFTDHQVRTGLDDSVPVQAKEYGGGIAAGVNLGNVARVELGALYKEVEPEVDTFSLDGNLTRYERVSVRQKIFRWTASVEADTFDDPFFPTEGYAGEIVFSHTYTPDSGTDMTYSQFFGTVTAAFTRDAHTVLMKVAGGKTFDTEDFDETQDFNSFFTLGGLFNLSGLPTNAVTGDEMLFGSLIYRYRLTEKDFFGSLGFPLYAGGSFETGDAWYTHYTENRALRENILTSGSLFLAADTVLGPFYFAVGATEGGYHTLYLSLGKSF